MSLVKWGPLKELEDMRREMDRLFYDFFPAQRRRQVWEGKPVSGLAVPNIEIYDRTNEIVFRAELPGVRKEDIDLSVTQDSLTLKGQLKRDEEVKPEALYASEICYGGFARTVTLPVEIDSGKAAATFKNGILELVLPKKEEAKSREIKIEVS
jgi:HSP20 family protein